MEMLHAFPQIIPLNPDRTQYAGFLTAQGESFHISVRLKHAGSLEDAKVECEWRLRDLLQNYEEIISQRLKKSKSLVDFLQEIQRILELQLGRHARHHDPPPAIVYSQLINNIQQIGWHRLVYIDSAFKELHLVAEDSKQRKHILKVLLHDNHPSEGPRCTADFPKALDISWNSKSTLRDLLDQFTRHMEQYEVLWDTLDEIDKNTWVLEPEKPTRADCSRRISLGNNVSIQISVNPSHPRSFPECRFLGADHVINPLKSKLNGNSHKWDTETSLLTNLQQVLEITFPAPTKSMPQEMTMECGVCYAYRLDDQIPDQVCDDPRCGQPFHYACLFEWLRSLPSFRQSFNVAFGECPYCSTPITVKMQTR